MAPRLASAITSRPAPRIKSIALGESEQAKRTSAPSISTSTTDTAPIVYTSLKREQQIELILESLALAETYRSSDGTAFVDVIVGRRRETLKVRSDAFRNWLSQTYFSKTHAAANRGALAAVVDTMEARAKFGSVERPVFVRVGADQRDDTYYLDLAGDNGQVVEVNSSGWKDRGGASVRFIHPPGMQSLPRPHIGGKLDAFRQMLNLSNESDWVLIVSWLLAALRPHGPYPILVISGEQGTAKSTTVEMLRSLVDPNSAALRPPPSSPRDLFIGATNAHLLAYDNISTLPSSISDALCRVATGGAYATRQLYSDQTETLLQACRPIILNGIGDIVTKPDLADRAIFISLQSIPKEKRRALSDLQREFDVERPKVLGRLLKAMVHGLKNLPSIRRNSAPRMADFAQWATACETSFWTSGTFLTAYESNRREAIDTVIEGDVVAVALRSLIRETGEWSGTATELLGTLYSARDFRQPRHNCWPGSPAALANKLRGLQPALRELGIHQSYERIGHDRTRIIHITGLKSPISCARRIL